MGKGTYVALMNFDHGDGKVGVKGKPYLGKDAKDLMDKGCLHDPVEDANIAAEEAVFEAEKMVAEAEEKKKAADAKKKAAKKAKSED